MFAGDPFEDNPFFKYKKGKREDKRRGSYGVVYKAELNGKIFAVKKLRVDDVKMKYLKREIDALVKLKGCENIVTYHQVWFSNEENVHLAFSAHNYDLDENEEKIIVKLNDNKRFTFTPVRIYIVMEYCEGNLENIIHCVKDKKKYYFKQILNGLKSLDEMKIIHRDLKPNNIFIDSNNVVKIGDFGFALHKDSVTSSDLTQGRGCKEFRPPEVYDCDEIESMKVTGKVDVYSCGLIYYLMCLKRKVNRKELCTITEILRTYRMYCKVNDGLSIEDRELLNRMLAKDPSNRITIKELYEYVNNNTFNELFNSVCQSQIQSETLKCISLEEPENVNCLTSSFESLTCGEFGCTYKAKYKENLMIADRVTLKQLLSHSEYSALPNKFKLLEYLDHKNISKYLYLPMFQMMCRNYFGGILNSGHFFVAANISSTLKSFVRNEAFVNMLKKHKKALSKCMIKQILEGILYLHDHEILHLNLNPENIFITDRYTPKIGNIIPCNQVKYSKFHWFHFANEEINYVDAFMIDENNRIMMDYRADFYSLGLIFTEFWFENNRERLEAIEAMQYGFFDTASKHDIKQYVNDRETTMIIIEKSMGVLLKRLLRGLIHIYPNSRMERDELERQMKHKKLFQFETNAAASMTMNLRERHKNNEVEDATNRRGT
ncbi:hypothetical protein B4U80_13283 [Leptotrombidium deliense]|uniref:non-specific serine/threonine protein kinase n=1 Tax=Leptotrombidium deliense TaxID=299467 RepID=A0A443S934_9ACAR|nr:hypothetical protein B4U80_13283 [Leptotrombidium deliense]